MNTCNKTSNNKYFDSPARMDDARTFTDYRPSNSVDDMIRYSNNVMSSYDYRQFLIHNAVNIMDVNNTYTSNKVGNGTCNAKEIPFQTQCDINPVYSKCYTINSNGVGLNNVSNFGNIEENFADESVVSGANYSNINNNFANHPASVNYESFSNCNKESKEKFSNSPNMMKNNENFSNHPNNIRKYESFSNYPVVGANEGLLKNDDNYFIDNPAAVGKYRRNNN